MTDRILVVDVSPILYAVYSTQGHLCTSTGIPTGLIYGFLRTVSSYKKRTNADKVVLCFDRPGEIYKAELSVAYKGNRESTPEKRSMYEQVPALKEILAYTGWIMIDAEGYEADDCMAAITRAKVPRGNTVILVTPDNDMAQLTAEGAIIFRPKKGDVKKDYWWKAAEVESEFGVPVRHLLVWRAVVGDRSDNLPGINITPAKQERIKRCLNAEADRYASAEEFLAAHLASEDTEEKNRFIANYTVMKLHSPPNLNVVKGSSSTEDLAREFERLEFKSLLGKEGAYL